MLLLNSIDLNKISYGAQSNQDLGTTTNNIKDEKAYHNQIELKNNNLTRNHKI